MNFDTYSAPYFLGGGGLGGFIVAIIVTEVKFLAIVYGL